MGFLEFTVIGYVMTYLSIRCTQHSSRLTVANEMLSLLGSIQVDPFSPAHVPGPSTKATQFVSDDEVQQDEPPVISEDGDDESDEDTFQQLGRKADEAAAQEANRKAEAELAVKAKKRKWQSDKAEGKATEKGGKKVKKKKT
jgi:DNA-directed RNA polymerase I subunit RPA43